MPITCVLLLPMMSSSSFVQEWLEKNREEVKQVAVAAYNRIPDKLELEWLAT